MTRHITKLGVIYTREMKSVDFKRKKIVTTDVKLNRLEMADIIISPLDKNSLQIYTNME